MAVTSKIEVSLGTFLNGTPEGKLTFALTTSSSLFSSSVLDFGLNFDFFDFAFALPFATTGRAGDSASLPSPSSESRSRTEPFWLSPSRIPWSEGRTVPAALRRA